MKEVLFEREVKRVLHLKEVFVGKSGLTFERGLGR